MATQAAWEGPSSCDPLTDRQTAPGLGRSCAAVVETAQQGWVARAPLSRAGSITGGNGAWGQVWRRRGGGNVRTGTAAERARRGLWAEDAAPTRIAMSRSGHAPILRAACGVGRRRRLGNQRQGHTGPMASVITQRLREFCNSPPLSRESRLLGFVAASDNRTKFSV